MEYLPYIVIGLVALIIIVILVRCIRVVQQAKAYVIERLGAYKTTWNVGLHFKLPFAQQVVTIDNRIVKLEVSTEAFSQDLQTVSTVLAVNYRVSKDQSQNIYKEVGPSFEDVLITPVVNEVLKAVTAEYTAVDLIGSRGEVSVLLNEGLNSKLNEYGIYVNEINIINWDFSEEYIAAVEAKQVAEQNLIKTRTEQEQALVIANTEAEKRVIAAEAEASEIKVLAEANAESNRILTESLTELLLQYQTVQKWDGKLPEVKKQLEAAEQQAQQ